MREIEFRAWDNINKEMCSVNELSLQEFEIEGFRLDGSLAILYDGEFILEQYTGLLDKNGKKIFEGDKLRYYSRTLKQDCANGMHPDRWVFRVEYNNCCFGVIGDSKELHHVDDLLFKPFYDKECDEIYDTMAHTEIIGNIHE